MLYRYKPLAQQEAIDLQQKHREGFPVITNWFDKIKADTDASTVEVSKKENSFPSQ